MKRREFLTAGMFAGVGLTGLNSFGAEEIAGNKILRIVHLTDMHIEPGPKIEKAIGTLVKEINSLAEKPDFILNTGDNIMDALSRDKENVHNQWQAWQGYFYNKLSVELHSCIGNHDIWGWGNGNYTIEKDPLFGKSWAAAMLKMPDRYYSFERKGWKFICLDSSYRDTGNKGYTAKLDKEQFAWLKDELKRTPPDTFICIVSHIPILSVSVFFDGDNFKKGNWQIPGAWMHTDARDLNNLFYEYPNVKAALSGHIHLADKAEYLGVKYFCNGAVCGKWWMGKYHEFGPAWAVVDFYDDGAVKSQLNQLNW